MSINEAESIIDLISSALQDNRYGHLLPISLLGNYNIYDIDTALKLRVAREFLAAFNGSISLEEFENLVENVYGSALLNIYPRLVSDNKLDELSALQPGTREYFRKEMEIELNAHNENGFKDDKFSSLETIASFSAFCKEISGDDPLYWQKVYTRLGLRYTEKSPQANYLY